MPPLRIAIAGFGSIGQLVGRCLDMGRPGLQLVSVSAARLERARDRVAGFRGSVAVVPLARIADEADVVVECTPPDIFVDAVTPAIAHGRTIVTVSAAALLDHEDVVERARAAGSRVILVSGSVAGLDGLRAAAIGTIRSVRMLTRKPPLSLARSPWLERQGIDATRITAPTKIFDGSARDAARHFPDKFNLAATVALAGIGPDRTQIEIWLDPGVERNVHRIAVDADSTRFETEIHNVPNPGHEGTGPLVAYSVVAALQDLTASLRVGT